MRSSLGFTRIEAMAVVLSVVICAVAVGVIFKPARRGATARQLGGYSQMRETARAMSLWANANGGLRPLPSRVDLADATVAEKGRGKDTTGNMLSILLWHGYVKPEGLVEPAEKSAEVERCRGYRLTAPGAAVRRNDAQWDPAFRGTPLDVTGERANQSYAYLVPIGARLKMWSEEWSSPETAVMGNRGPTYDAADNGTYPATGRWSLPATPTGTGSVTLLIHGGRSTWEGCIAHADGHVGFETKVNPEVATYLRAEGTPRRVADNFFVNETDEEGGDGAGGFDRGKNAYLRPVARMRVVGEGEAGVRPVMWRD